ncbi:hypothetical protein [Croceicoccus bisphenolivorans]|uniref:hypothetical protein n=1 Tax=Croceicoccus bisphenolivorans TaxID=1783232 RepID=UPI000B15E1A7|nr:hypothetical protein [Croceicoccus bisphenolivorans]
MPLWIELLVSLLIVYGATVTLAIMVFSRRLRLLQLLRLRAARNLMLRQGTKIEDESDG